MKKSHTPPLVGRSLALGGLALAALGFTSIASAQRPAFPDLHLGAETRGEAAVQALGGRLPEVAAHYRFSPDRLRAILRKDAASRLDPRGRLFYVERSANEITGSGPAVEQTAPFDLSQTFLLQSKPDSQRVMYLDFNGYTATNTAWNSGTINAQPYDTDGNPSSFSDAEKEAIQKVWQRVAEDYAPFDVNVTTMDPGADAIQRTSSTDAQFGTRVVVTPTTFYNCSCGGVAYVGTYDYSNSTNPGLYQPAWVFSDALGNSEKNIAEAAAHEAGHNLGLSHDGRTSPSEGYYAGHGSGETGWAPIMGVGYYRNLSQWSRGEYAAANNLQDDVTVITGNGPALRPDDAGNSVAAATNLSGSASAGTVSVDRLGLIGSQTDVDVYAFVAGGGTVQFDISPAALGPNLDVRADLLDGAGNIIATSNPAEALGANLNVSVSGGSYFLRVDGVGRGDLTTGYSDYGSLGAYRITGSYTDTGAAAPVAALTANPVNGTAPLAVSFDAGNSADSDGTIQTYAWNFGDGSTGSGLTAGHNYTSAGSFVATLTVTDGQGLSDSESVTITVSAATQPIFVKSIAVSGGAVRGGYQCTATLAVQNGSGSAVPNATVSGAWSGTVTGSASAVTGGSGTAVLKSGKTKKRGTCSFAVTNLGASGSTYQPASNLQNSGSATY
ncbi:MAG: PKD domain-containing protein [Panacagrimonas sp.]